MKIKFEEILAEEILVEESLVRFHFEATGVD
jgi:hypothetical protein